MAQREVLRDLAVRFGVVTDTKALDAFDKRIESAKKHMEEAGASFSEAGGQLRKLGEQFAAVGLAGGALIAGMGLLSNETATYAVAVERQAAMLGMTTDAYQELRGVMERFGVDQRDVADLFAQIAQQSLAAEGGAKNIVGAFDALGISVGDLEGKDPEALFLAIADGAERTGDATKRLAALSSILGEDLTKKLGPLLMKGSAGIAEFRKQLRETGVVLDSEAIKASQEYAASLTTLKTTIRGIGQQIGIAFLPAVKQLADSMGAWLKRNRELIKQRIDQVVGNLARAMALVVRVGAVFVRNIRTIEFALTAATVAAAGLFAALAAFRAGSAAYAAISGITVLVGMLGTALFDAAAAGGVLEGVGLLLATLTLPEVAVAVAVIGFAFVELAAAAALATAQLLAIYAAAEDAVTFLSGSGRSVLGDIVNRFKDADGAAGGWARTLLMVRATLGQVAVIAGALAQILGNTMQPALDAAAGKFAAFQTAAYNAFSTIGGYISDFLGIPLNGIAGTLQTLQGYLGGIAGGLANTAANGGGVGSLLPGGFSPGGGAMANTLGAGSSAINTVSNSTSIGPVSVTTGSGDPQQIGAAVSGALEAHAKAGRRQTAQSFTGGPR